MTSEKGQAPDPAESGSPTGAREKICRVCGDKALGYNFNAITCESCKAFFRRNALKNKEFKCPFNKNCEINAVTRRFCQLCRLIKCFEVGMRKEYIMSEDDKREKWKKIEENRAHKKRSGEEEDVGERWANSEPKRKQGRLENENEDEGFDDGETSGNGGAGGEDESKAFGGNKLVKTNALNRASASSSSSSGKPYMKKETNVESNVDGTVSFSSSGASEPSSPEMSTVSDLRIMFDETSSSAETNQSKQSTSPEIGQAPRPKSAGENDKCYTDSNIIKIILDSEFSKSSEVYTNSTVGRQRDEEQICNFRNNSPEDKKAYAAISKSELLDFVKNEKNLLLEFTKDGKNYLVINRGALIEESSNSSYRRGSPGTNNLPLPSRRDSKTEISQSSPISFVDGRNMPLDSQNIPPRKNSEDIFQDIPRTSSLCITNSIDSILSEAIKLEYEAYTSMNSRMNSRELNDAERAKLNELIVANKALLAPLEDDLSGDDYGFNALVGCGPSVLVDVLNLTAVAIRRLIKMSKKINAFKNMCQDDQIALLKGGCTEMMILRSAMTYDSDRDSWKIPQSKEKLMNIKVDILKEAGGRVFEEHQRFLQTFDPKWRNDENIMIILSAIALFAPDRPRVVHYDVIKLEQNSYYYLLRRYLESVYQGCEARLTFLKLIHKISELHKLNEDHVRVYLDANPREIEPLLIEIFDLKPH